jgi:hypothetical protein
MINEMVGPCSLFEIYEPISDSCISALNVASAPNTWQDVSLNNESFSKVIWFLAPIKKIEICKKCMLLMKLMKA